MFVCLCVFVCVCARARVLVFVIFKSKKKNKYDKALINSLFSKQIGVHNEFKGHAIGCKIWVPYFTPVS